MLENAKKRTLPQCRASRPGAQPPSLAARAGRYCRSAVFAGIEILHGDGIRVASWCKAVSRSKKKSRARNFFIARLALANNVLPWPVENA